MVKSINEITLLTKLKKFNEIKQAEEGKEIRRIKEGTATITPIDKMINTKGVNALTRVGQFISVNADAEDVNELSPAIDQCTPLHTFANHYTFDRNVLSLIFQYV